MAFEIVFLLCLYLYLYVFQIITVFQVYPTKPRKYADIDKNGSSSIVLYIGLGMVAIGLVVTFVGLGDKGFQTLELQLVGPSLVGCGFIFAILQILYCTFPSLGRSCCDQNEESEKLLREEEMLEFNQIRVRESE